MAAKDETFDPNDLDSIDALLDEAELDALIDKPSEPPVVSVAPAPEQTIDMDAAAQVIDSNNKSLGGLDADVLNSLSEVAPAAVAPPLASASAAQSAVNTSKTVDDADDFLAKRAAAKNNPNVQMTADDMDAIKKMIIIFGSVLVVLTLTAIGIGVWGALSGSSSTLDEESQTLIESVKVVSDTNAETINSADKTIKSVEKKLDALNFQLEQLATDMLELGKSTPVSAPVVSTSTPALKSGIIDPLGLGAPVTPTPVDAKALTPAQASPAVVAVSADPSPVMLRKMAELNKKCLALKQS
ncbi:hypothetical protein [Thiomicrorhabdus aquaedulcis]|uniref:hypothetical protein n=1 Tax=Thiomicrorhabdus aquaedulcis TaxID=2211106 RepID=UPI000FDA9E95|nr:hypothetical protein [Thiomicrorhabdus aquaedulcis]